MAFNIWNHNLMFDSEEDLINDKKSSAYAVSEIFCCSYAPYFWEAIKIRYPEYTQYKQDEEKYKIFFSELDKDSKEYESEEME